METNKQILFYLCGRSGSGKDSIMKEVLKYNPSVKLLPPITNRKKRANEQDGVEYHFVSPKEFKTYVDDGKLLDYKVYYTFDENDEPFDQYYGYPKPTEPISIMSGPWDAYMDIIRNNSNLFRDKKFRIVPIYITLDQEWEFIHRMLEREKLNDAPRIKECCRRFCADQEAFPSNKEVASLIGKDKIVYNVHFSNAVSEVDNIIFKVLQEEIGHE